MDSTLDSAFELPSGWYVGAIHETADPSRPDRWSVTLYNDTTPPPNRLLAHGQAPTLSRALDRALEAIDKAAPSPRLKVGWSLAPNLSEILSSLLPKSAPIRRR